MQNSLQQINPRLAPCGNDPNVKLALAESEAGVGYKCIIKRRNNLVI